MNIDGRSSSVAESFVDLLKSITDGRKTIYISAPITTGPIFLQWYHAEGSALDPSSVEYKAKHRENVISHNCENARKKIEGIRSTNSNSLVIDPASFSISHWSQEEYYFFWGKIIECCINKVILLDGWQYSAGCCYEFLKAVYSGIETVAENGTPLSRGLGSSLILNAIQELKENSLPTVYLERVIQELGLPVVENTLPSQSTGDYKLHLSPSTVSVTQPLYKDEILNSLANNANIAQFISFSPGRELKLRFDRIIGINSGNLSSNREAIKALLSRAEDGLVNIRSFKPNQPKGGEFFYGKSDPDEIMSLLSLQASKGLYTIVNETIDINDGGISGVSFADILEFAPFDTPKCVDKAGVCSLPRAQAMHILESVYGFRPALNYDASIRIEFSIHPKKRGLHKDHTIIWETEEVETIPTTASIVWPNRFSQMIGDKVFGLLIADAVGLPVPKGTVISRSIAPFSLGLATEKWNTWMRTCPGTRAPGKYPTTSRWEDPFEFMKVNNHDSGGSGDYKNIASLLIQDGVYAEYSGSLISRVGKLPLIEGVRGRGDDFMVGNARPEKLPREVIDAVKKQHEKAYSALGPIEMEWVYDGLVVWILQLHRLREEIAIEKDIIYPGKPGSFQIFNTDQGLESLRALISAIKDTSQGIILRGDVGITSHFGDLLRSARIPSRIERIQ